MTNEDVRQLIIEALASGKLQPTTIVLGDNVQHQHRIENVEAGGIGFQIIEAAKPSIVRPREGDYNAVREYVEQRKKQDEVFKNYCLKHTRKQLCHFLSDEFGWEVDDHSYGRNFNRNR